MLVQIGTEDSRVVDSLGLGLSLDMADIESSVDRILSIDEFEFEEWQLNLTKIPKNLYTYSDEHQKLIHTLSEI